MKKHVKNILEEGFAGQLEKTFKLGSKEYRHLLRPEFVEECKRNSTAYHPSRTTVLYQLATMSACNPRIARSR